MEINERPVEYTFALSALSQYCIGSILDVGSGNSPFPELLQKCGYDITAIDQKRMRNRLKVDITKDSKFLQNKFQFITCISVLEHIPEVNSAMLNMFNMLLSGGYLVLTVPFGQHYHENIYKHPEAGYGQNYKFITQIFEQINIAYWGDVVDQKYYKAFTGRLWTFGERINPLQEVNADEAHLTCVLYQKQ